MQISIEVVLWIIIWWLIAWLMFFFSLWIVEGKLHAKRKLAATALIALIAVLIIPLLQQVEGYGGGVLNGLSPYIAFFIVILLMIGLAADEWKSAVIVSFVGILFLLIIYNIIVVIAGVTPAWPLFV